jgi:hypothetical protein
MAAVGWYLALVVVAVVLRALWNGRARLLPGIAHEKWLPFFGNLFHISRNYGTYYDW